jgi:hypothetical protein
MNEVVGGERLFIGGRGVGIEDVEADVAFDHFGHQRVHRAAAGGDVVEHVGAFRFLLEGALDRFHLPSDAAHAVEQFFLFLLSMSHKKTRFGLYKYTPAGISFLWGRDARLPQFIRKEAHVSDGSSRIQRSEPPFFSKLS